jgi:large subunit ribosomal protein L19
VNAIINKIEAKQMNTTHPEFCVGDTVTVTLKVIEGAKERQQLYKGIVMQRKGHGSTKTFTVRKASGNVYVERIFPLFSPLISEIKVIRRGAPRRAKLYYLRDLVGSSTGIKEKL